MSLQRGFKASANRLSVKLRRGQGCPPESPIDLEVIAERLKIAIVPLSSFAEQQPAAVRQLSITDSGAFSATTLQIDMGKRVIIHNDFHDRHRQRSNISHELSHVLLGHPFTYPIDASGCRNHDRDLEDEASWLSATILLSNEAALHIVHSAMNHDTACETYGVSMPLLRMRLNGSGAHIRTKRARHLGRIPALRPLAVLCRSRRDRHSPPTTSEFHKRDPETHRGQANLSSAAP